MSEQLKIILYLKDMVSDLIYINSIIASELMKITENSAVLRKSEDFQRITACISEHDNLNKHVIQILEKYNKSPIDQERKEILEYHNSKH